MKKVLFLTGTRADYGKLKSLMHRVEQHPLFELHIFVTGMHLLSKYGTTYREIENDGFRNIYKFVNQKLHQPMDITLSNTILGFSNYVTEMRPDLIVVHGDRIEALTGAMVGALNNIKVAHIEGGEVSGTIDESIRHAITKFAHIHLVANKEARNRVMQLGESEDSIHIIGSPDVDIMYSSHLPSLQQVKERYEIPFSTYAIFMYHPVTTEVQLLREHISQVVDALIASGDNYVVIYPNNDEGSQVILDAFSTFESHAQRFRVFPSLRFEHFLTLLQFAQYMIGNSSAGIRETEVYGIPSINIGSRQQGRYDPKHSRHIIHSPEKTDSILASIAAANRLQLSNQSSFGEGDSDERFIKILEGDRIWQDDIQKKFISFENIV